MTIKQLPIIIAALFCLNGLALASAESKIRAGNSQYKKGKFDKALENYREAQIAAPASPEIHYNIGDALYKTENMDEASAAFNKALASKDKKVRGAAYYNLGNAAYRQQKIDEAVGHYKKALELNPADRDAKYNLEYIMTQKNQQKKQGKNDKDQNNKDGKDKNQQQKAQAGQDKKNDKDKKGMSKEDAQRILQYYNDMDKNSAKKRKMQQPQLPKTEEDW